MTQRKVSIGNLNLTVLTDKSNTDLTMEIISMVDAIARGEEALIIVKCIMTPEQHRQRQNIRNFLLTATKDELQKELQISKERNETFRAQCIQELIDES